MWWRPFTRKFLPKSLPWRPVKTRLTPASAGGTGVTVPQGRAGGGVPGVNNPRAVQVEVEPPLHPCTSSVTPGIQGHPNGGGLRQPFVYLLWALKSPRRRGARAQCQRGGNGALSL